MGAPARRLLSLGVRPVIICAGLALAGCFPTYRPGSFPVAAQQLGCIDASVLATRRTEATGPVVVIYLGNRCDHAVTIDLARLTVIGGNDAGNHAALVAYDPDREIAPRQIDAFGVGEEWIEYRDPATPAMAIGWLDVDVGRIAGDAPPAARWVRTGLAP